MNAVLPFDVRDEFAQKEIAIQYRPVSGIDIEAAPAFGRDNEELANLVLSEQIVEQRPATAIE